MIEWGAEAVLEAPVSDRRIRLLVAFFRRSSGFALRATSAEEPFAIVERKGGRFYLTTVDFPHRGSREQRARAELLVAELNRDHERRLEEARWPTS